MSPRAAFAEQKLRAVLNDGYKLTRYIYGDPPMEGEQFQEYLRRFGTETEDQKIKQGWLTALVPMHSILRGVIMPFVLGGKAKWFNRRREGADELEVGRNELFARIAQSVWDESDSKFELYRALDDAFWARVGWVETDLDDRIMWPRHKWVDCRDVLVDCETRSPDHRDMRWMGRKLLLDVDTAKWMAKELWDAPLHEFTTVTYGPEFEEQERERSEVVPGARRSDSSAAIDAPTEFVRLLRVFVKGENPQTTSAKIAKRDMGDPAGHDAMYDGKDHVLILEAAGGYGVKDSYKIVGRIDWPFPCDPGETPLTPVKLTRDNRNFYPYPITQPAHPLQVITNVAIQAYYTDMRNSARRIVGVQPQSFQNDTEASKVLKSDDALVAFMLKQGHTTEQAVKVANFGQPNSSLNTGQEMGRELYRLISGLQSFEVEVRANQTAFNTSVQNEQSQLKLHDLAEMPEWAATMMQRKALMCARANLNYDEVRAKVLSPKRDDGSLFEREALTSGGAKQVTSDLWATKPDWKEIRMEVDVNLEPRSMRFKNPDQQAAEVKEMMDYQMAMVRIAGDTLGKGNASGAQEILRVMNNSTTMICKLKNVLNYEELLANPEAFQPPEPEPAPPLDPNAVLDAQVQSQAINAQQQAAVTRMRNQGAPEGGIPAAMGGS